MVRRAGLDYQTSHFKLDTFFTRLKEVLRANTLSIMNTLDVFRFFIFLKCGFYPPLPLKRRVIVSVEEGIWTIRPGE